MACRDLSSRFIQLRTDAKAKSVRRRNISSMSPNEGNSLIRDADVREWEAARHALPPIWVDNVEEVNEVILKIKDKMEKLHRLHTKRLMVRFDGTEIQDEHDIDLATQCITSLFRDAEKILKRMASTRQTKNADSRIRENVQRGLATKLQSLSVEFRKSQKDYLSRVRKQKQGPSQFDFLSQNQSSARNSIDPGFSKTQMTEVALAEDLINERDEEIVQIAGSIEELATIFKELAVLVIDQGTILDRIDYNMEQVVKRTEKGLEQLERAEKIQKSSRPMKCIGLLLTLISVMTTILILKHLH